MTIWNPELYDQKHDFVSNLSKDLTSVLHPQKHEEILDIGCGTGDLTNEISKSGATVTGIDTSPSMIDAAKSKYPHIEFQVLDGVDFQLPQKFNAIFSNAVIHWIKHQKAFIENCYHALLSGGRLVAELGGENNVQSIIDAMKEAAKRLDLSFDESLLPWTFPTKVEMSTYLTDAGFTIQAIDHFERPTPLIGNDGIRNWLDMFSNQLTIDFTDEEKAAFYSTCEDILRPTQYKNGEWIADYWRLRFVAVKE